MEKPQRQAPRTWWPWLAGAAALLLLVAGGLVAWRFLDRPSDVERAVASLPEDTLRASYTDWAAVRALAAGEGLGPDAEARRVTRGRVLDFLDRAFEQDLVTNSAVSEATFAMHRDYGFSPLDAEWEVLGQGREGQVVVMSLGDGVDYDAIEDALARLGYEVPPEGAGSGGTWRGGPDLVATIDPSLTPVQQYLAVLADEGLVVLSDQPAPVAAAVAVVTGEADPLAEEGLAATAADPVTATLFASDLACEDLSMGQAAEEDQQVAERLVEAAGGVSPLTGFVVAQQNDGSLRLGLEFETDEQASENLQPRVDLAAGEAPGQGGSFADRFRITRGEASGSVVEIDLEPRRDAEFVFSDLTSGPVLLATC